MEGLLSDESLSSDDRALLHFGLAAVLDRRGLYARAAAVLEPPTSINPAPTSRAASALTPTSIPRLSTR